MKRARWIPVLVAGGLLSSCGEGLAPPTTGSIALVIQVEQLQGHGAAPALASVGEGSVVPALGVAGYTTARASADGPTPKSIDLALVDGFWEGTLADLNVGTYTVTVEGFVSGALAARGVRSGVGVTAGSQTSASVTLTSFVPGVNIGIGSPTTSLDRKSVV